MERLSKEVDFSWERGLSSIAPSPRCNFFFLYHMSSFLGRAQEPQDRRHPSDTVATPTTSQMRAKASCRLALIPGERKAVPPLSLSSPSSSSSSSSSSNSQLSPIIPHPSLLSLYISSPVSSALHQLLRRQGVSAPLTPIAEGLPSPSSVWLNRWISSFLALLPDLDA